MKCSSTYILRPSAFIISFTRSWCFAIAFLVGTFIHAQNTDSTNVATETVTLVPPPAPVASVDCRFVESNLPITDIAALSNLLRISNQSGKTVTLSINIRRPSFWKSLFQESKELVLKNGDSIYLPVRFVSNFSNLKGGVVYHFTALIKNKGSLEIYKPGFTALREKTSKMSIELEPGKVLYVANNEDVKRFKVRLVNEGEFEEQMLLKIEKTGKELCLSDSTKTFGRKNFAEFTLKPQSDTVLNFKATFFKDRRNLKRVDTYGYSLNSRLEAHRYFIFFRGYETGTSNTKIIRLEDGRDSIVRDVVKVGKSAQIVRLNSIKRVNQVETDDIPVTLMATTYNLLNFQPAMFLMAFGSKRLENGESFNYFLQNNFSYYTIGKQTARNIFGQASYIGQKATIMVGNGVRVNLRTMPLNMQVGGIGVAVTLRPNPKNAFGVALSRSKRNSNNGFQSVFATAGYSGEWRNVRFGAGYHGSFFGNNASLHSISARIVFPAFKMQTLNLFGSQNYYSGPYGKYSGYQIGLNYSIRYLKSRNGFTTVNGLYGEMPNNFLFGGIGGLLTAKQLMIQVDNSLRKDLTYYRLMNRLSILPAYNPGTSKFSNSVFVNNDFLTYNLNRNNARYTPGGYINYTDIFNQHILSGGVIFNVLTFNMEDNLRFALNTRSGYNKVLNNPKLPVFFTSQVNAFLSWRVFRMNIRYMYGPQFYNNITTQLTQQSKYSQVLFANFAHQYQFKNRQFVLENTLTYNYFNVNNKSGFGLFSQLFYYTYGGWNFNLNWTFNYNVAQMFGYGNQQPGFPVLVTPVEEKTKSFYYQIALGVRKDFSIPVPKKFCNRKNSSVKFKVFLDLNGNRRFDPDEITLPNVVIRVDEHEIQTDNAGEALLINLKLGKHSLQLLPIDDLGPWFYFGQDSINNDGVLMHYIPFSKGATIAGNVEIEQSELTKKMFSNFDLSRFKITLTDSTGSHYNTITDLKGNFSFYVPYGKYILSFNANQISKDFTLVENYVELHVYPGMESYYYSFQIFEKARKVKKKRFNADGVLIEE